MRDFSWIRSFALTEAFGPSEKDLISLRASKRERSKQSRSFARSKTRKQSCRISGSFPRPTKKNTTVATYFDSKQKKGEGFGNKQTAFYHSCKGSLLKLSTKGCFRLVKKGAVHYKLSALS